MLTLLKYRIFFGAGFYWRIVYRYYVVCERVQNFDASQKYFNTNSVFLTWYIVSTVETGVQCGA